MDSSLFSKSTIAVKDGLTYKEQDGPSTGAGAVANDPANVLSTANPATFTPPVTGSGSFGKGKTGSDARPDYDLQHGS